MEETVIPYELPEADDHSFFFIDQRIDVRMEAKLHRHEAWELYYVVQGRGTRMAGDTLQPFAEGDVVLIPPSMHHHWAYDPVSADNEGCIRYLMVVFSPAFVQHCIDVFPEIRNRLAGVPLPVLGPAEGFLHRVLSRDLLSSGLREHCNCGRRRTFRGSPDFHEQDCQVQGLPFLPVRL